MPQFTFFKMRGDAAINSFDILEFETAEQAKAYAGSMLIRSSYDNIEVCESETSLIVRRDQEISGGVSVR